MITVFVCVKLGESWLCMCRMMLRMQAIVLRCMKHLINSGSFKTAARPDAHVYSLFADESFVTAEFLYSCNYVECEYHHLVASTIKSYYYLHLLFFTLIVDFKIWFLTFVQFIFTITINSLYVSGMIETILLRSNIYKTKNINNDFFCSQNLCIVMLRITHLFLYHYVNSFKKSSFFLSTCQIHLRRLGKKKKNLGPPLLQKYQQKVVQD